MMRRRRYNLGRLKVSVQMRPAAAKHQTEKADGYIYCRVKYKKVSCAHMLSAKNISGKLVSTATPQHTATCAGACPKVIWISKF